MDTLIALLPADATSDAMVVRAPLAVARMSKTIRDMMDDVTPAPGLVLPLHNVSAASIARALAFCAHYVDGPPVDTAWDTAYFAGMAQADQFDVIMTLEFKLSKASQVSLLTVIASDL